MDIDEIEHKIACNELNASQVFTQMKQHVYRQSPCKFSCESQSFKIEARRYKGKYRHAAEILANIIAAHCGHFADVSREEALERELLKAEAFLET